MTLEELEDKRAEILARLPEMHAAGELGDPESIDLWGVVDAIVFFLSRRRLWRGLSERMPDEERPVRVFRSREHCLLVDFTTGGVSAIPVA